MTTTTTILCYVVCVCVDVCLSVYANASTIASADGMDEWVDCACIPLHVGLVLM